MGGYVCGLFGGYLLLLYMLRITILFIKHTYNIFYPSFGSRRIPFHDSSHNHERRPLGRDCLDPSIE